MSSAQQPQVIFVCIHNAGRSQIAAAYARAMAGSPIRVRSAGSDPAEGVHAVVRAALGEAGVGLDGAHPVRLTDDLVRTSDVVVTMGCGEICAAVPGQQREDWDVPDPAGRPLSEVRAIRDEIRERVGQLLSRLGVSPRPVL